MANAIYNSLKGSLGNIAWSSDTIKVMLVYSSYVPDIDTHTVVSNIKGEITGTGYTAGGATLANRTITVDTANDWAIYDADDTVWTTSTITARGAVIYKDTGTPSTSPLIAYIDFVSDKTSSESDFIITWHANGIFTIA